MPLFETATATASYQYRCEDRTTVLRSGERTVIAVADGAGGIGSGDIAAESVIREVKAEYDHIHSADQWSELLKQVDNRIGAGQSTAVVVDIRPYGIAGSSVGDSRAWIICDGLITDLTINQSRKPLLGFGMAAPVSFQHPTLDGILLVATDGFFDYAKQEAIPPLVSQTDFYSIPRTCIELVRLPSGDYWDDIGVVVARKCPPDRTRRPRGGH